MTRRLAVWALAIAGIVALTVLPGTAAAQTVVKFGWINSFTGLGAQAADEAQKAADLYLKLHEKALPPGVKLELIKRDDTSNPEVAKRLAQELIPREHVQLIAGVVLSPSAPAIAPLTVVAKVPMLPCLASAGGQSPRLSRYIARAGFTLWHAGYPIGQWARGRS